MPNQALLLAKAAADAARALRARAATCLMRSQQTAERYPSMRWS
jgi:hypothetical protein